MEANIKEDVAYLNYFSLVINEVIELGLKYEGSLANLITTETVHDICIDYFKDKLSEEEAANAVLMYWDRVYKMPKKVAQASLLTNQFPPPNSSYS